jgi:hypothetical protein
MLQVQILVISASASAVEDGAKIECSPLWAHTPTATLTIGHYHERHYNSTAVLVSRRWCCMWLLLIRDLFVRLMAIRRGAMQRGAM